MSNKFASSFWFPSYVLIYIVVSRIVFLELILNYTTPHFKSVILGIIEDERIFGISYLCKWKLRKRTIIYIHNIGVKPHIQISWQQNVLKLIYTEIQHKDILRLKYLFYYFLVLHIVQNTYSNANKNNSIYQEFAVRLINHYYFYVQNMLKNFIHFCFWYVKYLMLDIESSGENNSVDGNHCQGQ